YLCCTLIFVGRVLARDIPILILCTPSHALLVCFTFFFTHTAPTHIYTLSLHDALPISDVLLRGELQEALEPRARMLGPVALVPRSEEHTSELQSHLNLVCRLLLEKKKKKP